MDINKILINKYGLRTGLGLLLIRKRSNSTVYKVQTTNNSYALKVYAWPVAINFHNALLQQLDRNGFHQYPKVIKTMDGSNSVETEGKIYVLSEWIEGVKPSFSNLKQLRSASAFLAYFHRAAKAPEPIIKNARNNFMYPSTFHDIRIGEYKNSVIFSKLTEWVEQFGTDPLKIALEKMVCAEDLFPRDSYMDLLSSERKENSFIHGDYNYSNLILSPKGKMYLIDFDGSSYYMRISDLLFLCHLHMGKNAEMLIDILKSYHQVRPLSLTEFEIVKSLLVVPGKIYWDMRINTRLNSPIDQEWISKKLARYSSKEYYENIKRLSYSDLV